ncbi:MAG: hypothetical protein OEU32_01340 [Acidimicrobiia bacterium]|nr:hypothetical protein [Acidimicrobiia bacterium]
MQLRPGTRLKSTVCATEVIVVKAPADEIEVTCGGAAMVDPPTAPAESGTPSSDAADGSQLGKRYVDADDSIELLCTKAGDGSLAAGGAAMVLKESKPLPASD